jgi:hypothetical protein
MALSPGGAHVFYAGGALNQFRAVDTISPANLVAEATVTTAAHGLALAETLGVAITGDYVYLGAGVQGVLVYQHAGASN